MKTCQKRGCNFVLFENIIDKLLIPEQLDIMNKDHDLKGNYIGYRACHILGRIQKVWKTLSIMTPERK